MEIIWNSNSVLHLFTIHGPCTSFKREYHYNKENELRYSGREKT